MGVCVPGRYDRDAVCGQSEWCRTDKLTLGSLSSIPTNKMHSHLPIQHVLVFVFLAALTETLCMSFRIARKVASYNHFIHDPHSCSQPSEFQSQAQEAGSLMSGSGTCTAEEQASFISLVAVLIIFILIFVSGDGSIGVFFQDTCTIEK